MYTMFRHTQLVLEPAEHKHVICVQNPVSRPFAAGFP